MRTSLRLDMKSAPRLRLGNRNWLSLEARSQLLFLPLPGAWETAESGGRADLVGSGVT